MTEELRQLTKRVTQLEHDLRQLEAKLNADGQPWWKKIIGRHKGDEAFAEIVRLGREIREAERKGARAKGNGNAKRSRHLHKRSP